VRKLYKREDLGKGERGKFLAASSKRSKARLTATGARISSDNWRGSDMARQFSEIQEELSGLPASDRARLALALVESLEPEEEGDIAEAWRVEAERRYEQYRLGEIQAIPADQVFANVRRRLG